MNTKKNSWNIPFEKPEIPESLLKAGYNPLLAAVLALRGVSSPEEAAEFTRTDSASVHNPFLLKGMSEAIQRIHLAREQNEAIAVYGDYDVDGITATCLMTDFLRSLGIQVTAHIPDRIAEGYGLNCTAIDDFASQGIRLIITVDCGITAIKETLYAQQHGIDVIITDHHECSGNQLPHAVAVIDPKQTDDTYPFKNLCGVGVAWKVACAYTGHMEEMLDRYADLVAIGTVADVMPLISENKYIVQQGLNKIRTNPSLGLSAMLKEASIDATKFNASSLSYIISPRLNAAGRLGNASVAARLLMSVEPEAAQRLASELCSLNRKRQEIESTIWKDANQCLDGENITSPIVLSSDQWHQGVIGIAASRLAERYSVPTVMICLTGENGKGSCRSYSNFNIYEALSACSCHLLSFGGHASAAGLNISKNNIDAFTNAFREYYFAHLPDDLPEIDCNLLITEPDLLSRENVKSLDLLEPYGNANEKAVFCFYDVRLESVSTVANGRHMRLRAGIGSTSFEGIFFSHTAEQYDLHSGEQVDIAFSPQINEYNGHSSVQLYITGIRKHNPAELCEQILNGNYSNIAYALIRYNPDRKHFIRAWRLLERLNFNPGMQLEEILSYIPDYMSPETFSICLRTFYELGLIISDTNSVYGAERSKLQNKVDLNGAPVIRTINDYLLNAESRN